MDAVTHIKVGVTDPATLAKVVVIDAATGAVIDRVIEADAGTGMVRRFEVADGQLVRQGDDLVVIEETRDIVIEVVAPANLIVVSEDDAGDQR